VAPLQLAILLSIVVGCVIIATRPAHPHRRRRVATAARVRNGHAGPDQRPPASTTIDVSHRNRWDRVDILLAIGRDHADPDPGLTAWPAPTGAAALSPL